MLLNLRRLGAFGLVLALAACPTPVGTPTANAGNPLTGIAVGTVVQLDGSQSVSPQGRPLTFTWSFVGLPQGSHAALNDAHSETPSFTADVPGVFTAQLVVANAYLASQPATVTVTVTQCGANAPTAGALTSTPAAPGVGSVVTVSAPQADDADNDAACGLAQTESYAWQLISQPPGSAAALNNASALAPSFTADIAGSYGVRLIITDSTGLSSAPASLTITASACGSNAPVIGMITPSITLPGLGQQVQLTPQVSDADNALPPGCNLGQTFTYAWTILALPSGSNASLNSTTSSNPSFTPDVIGPYVFQLVVTDSTGLSSAPATVTVTATGCGGNAPTATIAFTPAHPQIGSSIQLSASVSDLDNAPAPGCNLGQTFTYAWSLRALPAGSSAQLNNPTSENPTFTADVSGSYVVELVVTDSTGLKSAPIDISPAITVSSCGNSPPVITEIDGPATPPNPGDTVTFTAIVTDADNAAGCAMGQTFTYAWSFAQRPSGSSAFILDPTAASGAKFVADKPGTYQVELIVTDSTGLSSAPKFQSTTATICGLNPPVIASTSPVGATPNPGQTVALGATWTDADNGAACNLATKQSSYITWTVVSRPPNSGATLTAPVTAATTTGTAPSTNFVPDVPGNYQFTAVATDSTGLSSAPAFVAFTATNCGTNAPLIGVVKSVYSGVAPFIALPSLTAIAVDPDNSVSCNEGQTVSCLWTIAQHPGASSAVFPDPTRCDQAPVTGSTPYAGFAPDVPGVYELSVVATDSTGLSSTPATVSVQVSSDCGTVGPSVGAPTAFLGTNSSNPITSTNVGQTATLQGGAITGNNCNPALVGAAFSDHWSIVSEPNGSQAVLSDPSAAMPTITFDKVGAYQFSLVVTDALGFSSDPVFLTITVAQCNQVALNWDTSPAPITFTVLDPDLGPTNTAYAGSFVTLTANFTDPNGQAGQCGGSVTLTPDTYQWQIISAPSGSRAQLSSSTASNPTFVPDIQGSYQVAAIVTDALGQSTPLDSSSFITISVSSCGANAPAITGLGTAATPVGFSSITVNTNALTPLNAAVTDPNTNGCPARFASTGFTYAWSLSQKPVGGSATVGLSTTANDNFVATVPSASPGVFDYEVSVVATAIPSGLTSAPGKLSINVSDCGASAPSISGFVLNSLTGSTVGGVISHPQAQGPGSAASAQLTVNASDADNAPGPGCHLGQSITFSWTLVSAPTGSAAVAPPTNTSTTADLIFDVAGSYTYSVVATDSTGLSSAPAQITITTAPCSPSFGGILLTDASTTHPIGSAVIGEALELALSGSITDECTVSPQFSYTWSVLGKPANSNAVLGAPTGLSTGFTPDAIGNYTIGLEIVDNGGFASAVATTTFAAANCATPVSNPTATIAASSSPFEPDPLNPAPGLPNRGDLVSLSAAVDDTGNTGGTGGPGACSSSVTVTPYTYSWSILSAPLGSRAVLTSTSSATPAFVPDVDGSYLIGLVVTDAIGSSTVLVTKTVTTTNCGLNAPMPTINGSASVDGAPAVNISTASNTSVELDGAPGDNDNICDNGALKNNPNGFKYAWSIVGVPTGGRGSLSSSSAATTFFSGVYTGSAPGGGVFGVQLIVTDDTGLSNSVTGVITVSNCGATPPAFATGGGAGILPTTGTQNVPITLSAPAVSNSNGSCGFTDTPTLAWTFTQRPPGSQAVLAGANGGAPTFTPDVAGNYAVLLTASDAEGDSSTLSQTIMVGPDSLTLTVGKGVQLVTEQSSPTTTTVVTLTTPTVLYVGTPVQVSFASVVQLSSGATICNGNPGPACTYAWSLTSLPPGSTASFNSPTAASPSFTPDVPLGSWTAHVVITAAGVTGSNDVIVTTGLCGAQAPTAIIGLSEPVVVAPAAMLSQSVTVGSTVQFNPTVTDPDSQSTCNLPVTTPTYAWSITSKPAQSTATLSSATQQAPTLVADQPGVYVVNLLVTDSTGLTGNASATITATGSNTDLVASALPFPAIAIDPTTGNPVIAVLENANGGTVAVYQCVAHCNGSGQPAFNRLVVDTNVGVPTWQPLAEPHPVDVKVNSTGNIYVIYHSLNAGSSSTLFPDRLACGVTLASYQQGAWAYGDITGGFIPPSECGDVEQLGPEDDCTGLMPLACSADGSLGFEAGRSLALAINTADELAAAMIVRGQDGSLTSEFNACVAQGSTGSSGSSGSSGPSGDAVPAVTPDVGSNCDVSAATQAPLWNYEAWEFDLSYGSVQPQITISDNAGNGQFDVVVATNTYGQKIDGTVLPPPTGAQPGQAVDFLFQDSSTTGVVALDPDAQFIADGGVVSSPLSDVNGYYPSVAHTSVTTENGPVVTTAFAYYDVSTAQLQLSECQGLNAAGCEPVTATVDTTSGSDDIGRFANISVDPTTNSANFAYLDSTAGTLKLAAAINIPSGSPTVVVQTIAAGAVSSTMISGGGFVYVVYGNSSGGLQYYAGTPPAQSGP